MMKNKTTDKTMIDAFHPETASGHSIGTFGAASSGGSPAGSEHGDGGSIAAETTYFTAICNGCSFRGDPTTERPAVLEQARQHMVDYPGHSAYVEAKSAPTS
jgi:hypothetical protein